MGLKFTKTTVGGGVVRVGGTIESNQSISYYRHLSVRWLISHDLKISNNNQEPIMAY